MLSLYLKRIFQWVVPALLISVLLFAVSGQQKVRAQSQAGVTLTAQAGFDGYCKESHWLPVRVTVENKGADLDARIQLTYPNNAGGLSTYGTDIALPTTSRKEFFLYLYPEANLKVLKISLTAGGQELASMPLKVNCIFGDLLVAVLTDDPTPYNALNNVNSMNGNIRVAQVQLADLPDRPQGWEGLDALIISGVDTGSMTEDQRRALDSWLAQGGKLLVVGGPKWQSTVAGLDKALLPVDLSSTRRLDSLSELPGYFKTSAPLDGEALLAVGQTRAGAHVMVEQAGVPVIVKKQVGFGTVYYLAADPGLQPLSGWTGMKDVYASLLSSRSGQPAWANPAWGSYSSNQALSTLPALGLPSFLYVFCWLGVYVLVLGPLNYLVLRRIKRPELAWVTIPALVLLFTGIAYFSGSLIRGTQPILNRLAVSQAWEGVERSEVQALVGIYSPYRTKYALDAGDLFMPYPAENTDPTLQANNDWFSLQKGLNMLLPDVLVESGGMQAVAVTGNLPAIKVTHHLVLSLGSRDPVLTGKITNTSGYTLNDAILVTSGASKDLGDFSAGDTRQINVSLATTPDGPEFYNRPISSPYMNYSNTELDDKTVRRNALMDTALSSQYTRQNTGNWGIYLIGWVDEPLLPVGLQGSEFTAVDTMLSISMLSPRVQADPEPLNLTPSLFTWEGSDQYSSPYHAQNTSGEGFTLYFKLAVPLDYSAVKSLTLRLNSDHSTSAVLASLWDWERDEWVQIPNLAWGSTVIPDASRYVGPGAEIRLKVDGSQGDWYETNASYFTLVVEP